MLDDADQELSGDMMLSTRPVILGPNITGGFGGGYATYSKAFSRGDTADIADKGSSVGIYQVSFDASKSNSIYDNSETVQPSSLILNYIIKY